MSRRSETLITHAVLLAFALFALAPMIGIVLLALHSPGALVSGLSLPDGIHLETFSNAWETGRFSKYFKSSVIVSLSVMAASTFLSILTGYAFGTMKFRGHNALFLIMLLGLIMPFEVTIIPLYYDLRSLHMDNTYFAIILPQAALTVSFGTFWMRAYFRSVPPTLIEAARVDGASSWTTLWRVLLPAGRPAVVTLMLLVFMWSWNDFLLPLVMVSDDNLRTAPLGLAFFTQQYTSDRVGQAAGAILVALPVVFVYVIFQRHFIRGMFAGAIKG